jgi:hypothetical protein
VLLQDCGYHWVFLTCVFLPLELNSQTGNTISLPSSVERSCGPTEQTRILSVSPELNLSRLALNIYPSNGAVGNAWSYTTTSPHALSYRNVPVQSRVAEQRGYFNLILNFFNRCTVVQLYRCTVVPLYCPSCYYRYNEQTNAHSIDSLLYCSIFIAPTCFNTKRHPQGALTRFLLSHINVFMQSWCCFQKLTHSLFRKVKTLKH